MGALISVGSVNTGTNKTVTGILSCTQCSIGIRTVERINVNSIVNAVFFCCIYKTSCHLIIVRTVTILCTDGYLTLGTLKSIANTSHINRKKFSNIFWNGSACTMTNLFKYCHMLVNLAKRCDEYLRVIWHELSRIHSHLLWLGLAADAFGFESMFMHCWRLRERVLDLFEKTTGGRVILSVVKVGGVVRDIDASQMAEIVSVLDGIKGEYTQIMNTLLTDTSVKNRTVGVGHITTEDAAALSMVGPFARASNLPYDVRSFGRGAYGDLADFAPITATEGDCYARVKVRCLEVLQSIEIIKELGAKIPAGDIEVAVKGAPADGAQASNVLEQPRGECYYYARGNGSKNLERMRMRTPTSQNLAGMTVALKGCDLADVNMIILTIDPCISCTER